MAAIDLVFSDIDNTLIHKGAMSKLLQIAGEETYISPRTIRLAYDVAVTSNVPFVLITGRRLSGLVRVLDKLPFAEAVMEHGCVVLEKNGTADPAFQMAFKQYTDGKGKHEGLLWDYEKDLIKRGFKTDSEGRFSSFRVLTVGWPEDRILAFSRMPHPNNLKAVINLNNVDILPPMGGKEVAIQYIMAKHGTDWRRVACLGDDFNDSDMLSKAGVPITHAGARPEIRELVSRRGGYVSPFDGQQAAADMLAQVLSIIQDKPRTPLKVKLEFSPAK